MPGSRQPSLKNAARPQNLRPPPQPHRVFAARWGQPHPRHVARAAELEMPALGLTDHGVMYGAIQFYKACKDAGIKPIVGCEVDVAPRSRLMREGRVDRDPSHLTLLAASHEGYLNLMKLCTVGQMEGMYYKPRIDKEILAEHSAGLIALSGCLQGEVA